MSDPIKLADMYAEGAPLPMAQRSLGAYLDRKQNDPSNYVTLANQGATRNLPIDETLQRNLQTALTAVYGPGYRAQVYSGGQPALGSGGARVGSTRHDGGRAADLYVLDPTGQRVTGDKLANLGRHWLENRFGGVGLEMRGGGIHLDMHQNRAPIWTYGPVSPAQAELVRQFGGRAPQVAARTMQAPAAVAGGPAPAAMQPGRALPMFAQGVTPAAAAPQVNPQAVAAPLIAQMFMQQQAQQDQQAEEQRRDEEAAARARRRALFSGPSPFG